MALAVIAVRPPELQQRSQQRPDDPRIFNCDLLVPYQLRPRAGLLSHWQQVPHCNDVPAVAWFNSMVADY